MAWAQGLPGLAGTLSTPSQMQLRSVDTLGLSIPRLVVQFTQSSNVIVSGFCCRKTDRWLENVLSLPRACWCQHVLLGIGLRKHGDFSSPPPTSIQGFGERSQVTDLLEQPLSVYRPWMISLPFHVLSRQKKIFGNVCAFDLLKNPLASPLTKSHTAMTTKVL